jgi:hypothetical protein
MWVKTADARKRIEPMLSSKEADTFKSAPPAGGKAYSTRYEHGECPQEEDAQEGPKEYHLSA